MNHDLPKHGGQLRSIAESFGIPVANLLDFSANINPDGPPPGVLNAIRDSLEDPQTVNLYPDLDQRALKSALADYANCCRENVLVANGLVPLLQASLKALTIRSCLLPVPAFTEYRRVLEANDVAVTSIALTSDRNFAYDVETLLAQRYDAILLANPQNPSGALCDKATMMELVERAAAIGTYVLLDEAFIDYASHASLAEEVARRSNLIVFRSVTKCFGLPGLRTAYAIAPTLLHAGIERLLAPWPISTLAAIGVIAAVQSKALIAEYPNINFNRRVALTHSMQPLGLRVFPGAANFLLLGLSKEYDEQHVWKRLVAEHGIVLRSCLDFEGLPPGYLRTAVLGTRQSTLLVNAISLVLST